jgi:hypothetical protein
MSDRKPEEILDVNKRWLPPSPHVEKVIEMVGKGAAHIEKRGHHEPPLIMFEDGGVIELPKARYEETYRGMQLVSSDDAEQEGVTKFRDVCGCVDYIQGTHKDNPESIEADPHAFDQLLDHALYMVSRMQKREDEYRQFLVDVIAVCAQVPRSPSPKMASNAAEEIKMLLHNHPEDVRKYTDLLNQLAEDVRHVASKQEKCLKEHKALAVKVLSLYKAVKGARNWEKEENEAG